MADEVHKLSLILPPILTVVAFIVTCFFNYLASQDACCLHLGIFHSTTGNLSNKYYLEITPAGWAFSIWGVIYAYQVLWLMYGLSLFCRKNPATGGYLYYSPLYMSPLMYMVMVLNFGCNIAWLLIWDREELWWGVLLLFLTALTLYVAIGISMFLINKNARIMARDDIRKEIYFVIGFVHNGLGMYATWTTIATLLNLGSALIYREPNFEQQTASSLCLGILTLEILLWVIMDNIIIQKYTRYLLTPYLVLIYALVGSLDKNWDSENPVSIFTAALLVIAVVAMIFKVGLVIYRQRRQPVYRTYLGEQEPFNVKPTTLYS